MVFKKSFTFLVATGTTPVFAVFSIISDSDCPSKNSDTKYSTLFEPEVRTSRLSWISTKNYFASNFAFKQLIG